MGTQKKTKRRLVPGLGVVYIVVDLVEGVNGFPDHAPEPSVTLQDFFGFFDSLFDFLVHRSIHEGYPMT